MAHDKRVSYGVAILLWRGPKLLLIRRAGAHEAGTWACPGGWVNCGEYSFETVVREAKEELGIEVEVDLSDFATFREETHATGPDGLQSLSLYFNARLVSGEPCIMEPDKCSALRWVDLHDPRTWPSPLFPNLAGVLEELAMELDDMEPCE